MQTKAEKIEQLMCFNWEVGKSSELYAFANKILTAAERGESELAIKMQLADFQKQKLGQPINNDANGQIITWLNKVVSGNA
jgi:hypothetical protein